ncbi:oxidoreductase [Planctomycetota bacterium]|nr:oxidoreductase [Planctomycetota bacterium]
MTDGIASDRSETVFKDFKSGFSREQALVEANRCFFCSDAPCIKACPTQIDIPQFIRKITTGNVKGSARTIFESNILGMSCARVCPVEVLCVSTCVYNGLDQPPIQIGKLQRYSTDFAIAEGWRFFAAGPDSGKSVGLIGAGPASLACAHELRRHGHRVTIYEKRTSIGGLNTTGVAPYKMKADCSVEEVAWILGIGGIEVKTGVTIGVDIAVKDLEQLHNAVFFGAGLGADTKLRVPGEHLAGVHGAVEWIESMKLARVATAGVQHCVVVGGGNTAIDAVREARGLGIPRVTMLYRGSEVKMSGYAHEWRSALPEGGCAEWQAIVTRFEGSQSVERLHCQRLDAQKQPISGSDFVLDAQLVLLAIGQSKLGTLLAGLEGIEIEGGRIVTDAHGSTGRKGWFAGGDCRNGGKEVVNAAAEGKSAALAIHAYFSGGKHA